MKIDQSNTPLNLAGRNNENTENHATRCHESLTIWGKFGPKTKYPFSNIATRSSPNTLNWESAKHACLDRKNFTKTPLPAKVMQDLQRWSEDELSIEKQEQKTQ